MRNEDWFINGWYFWRQWIGIRKKITFIFGKNGTGKSTFTEEIKKMTSDYDVSVFQGFRKVGIYW